jgi:hypothetical protein
MYIAVSRSRRDHSSYKELSYRMKEKLKGMRGRKEKKEDKRSEKILKLPTPPTHFLSLI